MRTLVRRHLVVAGLILVAGLAAAAAGLPDPASPALPAAQALTDGTDWSPAGATPPLAFADRSRQWLLEDGAGHQALLFVGTTARPRVLLEWSGELGYQGAGYVVVGQQDGWLRLAGGRQAAIAETTMRRLGDRRLLRSAVVGPTGVARQGWDLVIPAAWDAMRDQRDAYYFVRVAVADGPGARDRADAVLAAVLTRLASSPRPR